MTAQRFVLELGRAMHALGSPSYRVEDAMAACAQNLGLQGSFFATPTAIFAALGRPGERHDTELLRVQPGNHDLGKLAALYRVRDDVLQGRCDADVGRERIGAILTAPPTGGRWPQLPAFALASAAACVFLGGGVREIAVAGAVGLLVAAFGELATRHGPLQRAFEPLASLLAALLVHLIAAAGCRLNVSVATIASVIVMLPGLSFTTALAELAVRHLAAGSARLLGALAVLLTMAVGVGIGSRLGAALTGEAVDPAPLALPLWWRLPAAVAAGLAFAVLLRATRRQVGWVLLAVGIAYGGASVGNSTLHHQLGAFAGSLAVAGAANLYARWRRQPAAVVRIPGLLLLVPGSLGFQGLTRLLTHEDMVEAMRPAFQMLVVGGALVAGMVFASLLVPPPRDVEPES